MSDATTWWRIELNDNGKIVAASKVELSEANSKTIVYVQAFHEVDARTMARRVYNEYTRQAVARRRERLIAEGKCGWCGEQADREPGLRCSTCIARDKKYEQRRRDKQAGRPVEKLDRRVALAERRGIQEASWAQRAVAVAEPSLRLQILQEVQNAWLDNRTVGAFSAWLNGEVEKLAGKRVA
jgi:hypothetical protein